MPIAMKHLTYYLASRRIRNFASIAMGARMNGDGVPLARGVGASTATIRRVCTGASARYRLLIRALSPLGVDVAFATVDELVLRQECHADNRYRGYCQAFTEAVVMFNSAWMIAGSTTPETGPSRCTLLTPLSITPDHSRKDRSELSVATRMTMRIGTELPGSTALAIPSDRASCRALWSANAESQGTESA